MSDLGKAHAACRDGFKILGGMRVIFERPDGLVSGRWIPCGRLRRDEVADSYLSGDGCIAGSSLSSFGEIVH